jgi:hypothetical protein
MDGYIGERSEETVDEQSGEDQDGNPLPLPFDEDGDDQQTDDKLADRADSPALWTPIEYKSRTAVYLTLSDVDFEEGTQQLTFDFNVRDWGVDLIDPISKAVRHDSETSPDGSVDITEVLDSVGRGADAFIQHAAVSSTRRP